MKKTTAPLNSAYTKTAIQAILVFRLEWFWLGFGDGRSTFRRSVNATTLSAREGWVLWDHHTADAKLPAAGVHSHVWWWGGAGIDTVCTVVIVTCRLLTWLTTYMTWLTTYNDAFSLPTTGTAQETHEVSHEPLGKKRKQQNPPVAGNNLPQLEARVEQHKSGGQRAGCRLRKLWSAADINIQFSGIVVSSSVKQRDQQQ